MTGHCGTRRTAVLLDPHPLFLDAVQEVLIRGEIEVLGKAASSMEALRLLREHRPDVVLMEIDLDDEDELEGIAFLRRAREILPSVRPIVVSSISVPDRVDAAFDAGALAYVVKTAHPDDLISAIRQAFDHSMYLAPFGGSSRLKRRVVPDGRSALTRRELEILQLVSCGLSNARVAGSLWVTEQTVKFHLSNIYKKLGVSNRTEASHWAVVHGLLGEESPIPTIG
jgi:DNA-binding NarL/FixJ family response regulator